MKNKIKFFYAVLASLIYLNGVALAQENSTNTWKYKLFTGTWKFKTNAVDLTKKPERQVLKDGRYQCFTCVPKIDVKADGKDQTVKGSVDFNTVAIKLLNGHSVQFTNKKNGKIVEKYTETVSMDSKTLTTQGKIFLHKGGPITYTTVSRRVKKAPAGANPISGEWQFNKLIKESENGLIVHYKAGPDELSMTWPGGYWYDAKLNGKDYPLHGESATTMSLRKINNRTIEETVKENKKVVRVYRITVSPDGKALSIRLKDKQTGRIWEEWAQKE